MKSRRFVGSVVVGAALGTLVLGCGSQAPGDDGQPVAEGADASVAAVVATTPPVSPVSTGHRRRLANGGLAGVKPYRGPGAVSPTVLDVSPSSAPVTGAAPGEVMQSADSADEDAGRFHPQVNPTCTGPKLSYFDGPLVQTPVIVPVFWSSSVNAALTAPTTGIAQFFADVTLSSTYWPWLQEYDSVGLAGGSNQVILPGTATAGVTLVPSRCATAVACTVTDAEIQTELLSQITAGKLPAPVVDCTGNAETIYMIAFPPKVTVNGPDGAGNSCQAFCAYHNTGTYTSGTTTIPLIYGVLMDEFTSNCATGCGNAVAPNQMENMTSTASHELIEAVTDPDIGLDTQNGYAKPAGWGDNNNQCGEIADICDTGAADTITVSGRTWSVQEVWSNKQGKCTSTGTPLPVCTGTTLTGCRKCSCGDNGGACSGGTAVCETTITNVLVGACEQCTSTNSTACGTGTCTQSTTAAQDDICSGGCIPVTTCPAGQNCGTASNGCGGTLNCGTCVAPDTCGGGGTANQCGAACVPLTACPAGQNCGTASDGCGGTLNCGTCALPQTCGGGGTANQCGAACVPLTTCPAGDNCGTLPDTCGGTLDCGTCTASQTCNASNQCVTTVVDSGTGNHDAGAGTDSGAIDSGSLADGSSGHDGSALGDSSAGHDGSTFADSGHDSATMAQDSGTESDSGASDGGRIIVANDAGIHIGGEDAAADGSDGGLNSGLTGGCSCRTAPSTKLPPSFGLLALLPVALIARRRNRRR